MAARVSPEPSTGAEVVQMHSNALATANMIAASASFTILNTSVKLLATKYSLPTFEIVCLRSSCMLLFIVAMVLAQLRLSPNEPINWVELWTGPKSARKALLLRGFFGFLGSSSTFWAVTLLPIPDAVTIININPIVTGFGSYIFLHEAYTLIDGLAAFFCMIGVMIITRPSFLFSGHPLLDLWILDNGTLPKSTLHLIGVTIALLGTVFIAGAALTLRYLGPRCQPHHNVIYFSVACITLPLLTIPIVGQPWTPPTPEAWGVLVFASVVGLSAQVLMTYAMKQAVTTARVTALSYAQVVFAFIAEWIVFGESPSAWSVVGAIIVGVSLTVATVAKEPPSVKVNETTPLIDERVTVEEG
ncbi:hypothetical protein BJ742DRAFT_152710 [Cladochytrium replicatum]|nr:hypothetical protein BJ742DRAFT_152710 [Cladochytrium replicatum]